MKTTSNIVIIDYIEEVHFPFMFQDMYEREGVSYLLDLTDTISAYESRGKEKHSSSHYQQGLEALSSMNRTQQVEVIHGTYQLRKKYAIVQGEEVCG